MKKLLLILILAAMAFISRAQTVQTLADSSFAKHDYVKAYTYYTEALKSDPQNIAWLRRAGFCLMNCQGQELNSTRFFADALKIKPNDPIANYYLGIVYMDEAKQSADTKVKDDFKAKAADYLNKADRYGNADAKAAIKDLNGI